MSTAVRPCRSVLFLPASNRRAAAKARGLDCDAVVLDLEDSVGAADKAQARAAALEEARAGGYGVRRLAVRVNGLDTPWGADDLKAVATEPFDAVVTPKINDGADISRYDAALSAAHKGLEIWATIETPRALLRLEDIAVMAGSTRLRMLMLGANDLAASLRLQPAPARAPLQPIMIMLVAVCRAYGLEVVDGGVNDYRDLEDLEAETVQARQFGFDGKSAIHPAQLPVIRRVFDGGVEERAWAEAVVAAYALPQNQGAGAIQVDGRMVERMHLAEAERLLRGHG